MLSMGHVCRLGCKRSFIDIHHFHFVVAHCAFYSVLVDCALAFSREMSVICSYQARIVQLMFQDQEKGEEGCFLHLL